MPRILIVIGFSLSGLLLADPGRADSNHDTEDTRNVSFAFNLRITPKPRSEKVVLTVVVPRTIPGKQKVLNLQYSQRPLREFTDRGTRYAEFVVLDSKKPVEIKIGVEAELYRCDLETVTAADKHLRETTGSLARWLIHEKYLEKDAEPVREAARSIQGKDEMDMLRNIMAHVHKTLTYSGYDPQDRGALWALQHRRGDCSEYTDLFVALCRAKNFPARVWEGYTVNEVAKGDTPKHAWAEVYTRSYGWVPFDPMHVASRAATFERLKPIYIYMDNLRSDPNVQNYHYYAWRYWGNPIECQDTFVLNQLRGRKPQK